MPANFRNNFLVLISKGDGAMRSWLWELISIKIENEIKGDYSKLLRGWTHNTHSHTLTHSAKLGAMTDKRSPVWWRCVCVCLCFRGKEGMWHCAQWHQGTMHTRQCVFLCMCVHTCPGEICAPERRDSCVISIHWPHFTPKLQITLSGFINITKAEINSLNNFLELQQGWKVQGATL